MKSYNSLTTKAKKKSGTTLPDWQARLSAMNGKIWKLFWSIISMYTLLTKTVALKSLKLKNLQSWDTKKQVYFAE